MIKVKVVKCVLDISLKQLIEKLSGLAELSSQSSLISLIEYSETSVSAVYVEKVVMREKIIDIHGEETEIDVVRYPRYQFELHQFDEKGGCLLLILNPPRSLKILVDFLIQVTNGHVFFKELKLSVESFVSEIITFDKIKYYLVDKVKAKGVEVSNSSYADVSMSSSKNAYEDLERFLDKKSYTISNIRMRVSTNFGEGKVEISSSGLLGLDHNVYEEVLEFFLCSAKNIVKY
ncbi:hypothetical protein RVM26_10000 [Halomonas sp. KM072]